jgi:hypothetical protein
VIYSGTAQTVRAVAYRHLTLSGSGTKTLQSGTTAISGNLTLSGTAAATTVVSLTIGGNLSIGDGATFTAADNNLTVTGTTTVGGGTSGNLTISFVTGTKIFTGLVTINAGATWNNSGNSTVTFRGGITTTPTFTGGSGLHTFDAGVSKTLTGTFSIPNVTVTGVTLNNSGTLTVGTALAGNGTLVNAATGTLNLGGTSAITTLTATAVGNTVNYTGAAQTVKATTYHHLSLGGSGAKTLTGLSTINGNLTLSGTATATTAANLSIGGNLTIGDGTTFATASTYTLSVTGTTTVGGGTSGTLTLAGTGNKTFTGDVTINTGGLWNETGVAAYSFGGSLQNGGTLTANTGVHIFTGATKTFSGANAVVIPSVTVNGTYANNGTLTVNTALAGSGTLTQGASASAILNIGGTSATFTLVASGSGNTVNYTGAAQTVKATTYNNLIFSGSLAKTMTGATISGTLEIQGTATASFTGTATANALKFAGVTQATGTWGSSSSAAAFKDNGHFASTGVLTVATGGAVPVSYTGAPITENFNGLGTGGTSVTLLNGWNAGHFSTNPQQGTTGGEGLTPITDPLVATNGTHDPNGSPILGNFGTTGAADRALGSFARTTPAGDQFLQLAIKNDSGSAITSFVLSYRGEEWRSSDATVQPLTVWYSGTSATSGFVSMGSAFTFSSPNNLAGGAIDGNLAGNFTAISGTFTPASPIAAGSTFYLRWYDINENGIADDYLAIDDLTVTPGSGPLPPTVTLSLTGSPMAEAAGVATVTATLSATSASVVTVNLAFAGTATLTTDYTRSGASISIPAGELTGSITLTAVQDTVYENPNETIIVDIASVVNGTESGTQQVTATITDSNRAPVFSGYALSGMTGQPLSIYPAKILARASDPDGDAITLTRVFSPSAYGGTVALAGTVNYTPASGFVGTDTFEVEITDARGANMRGIITITVTDVATGEDALGLNRTYLKVHDGQADMVFRGIPRRSYTIQRSTDLINWINLGDVTAGDDGKIPFIDPPPLPDTAFYRTHSN